MRVKIAIVLALTILLLTACARRDANDHAHSYITQDDAQALVLRVSQDTKLRDFKSLQQEFADDAAINFQQGDVQNDFTPLGYVNDMDNRYRNIDSYNYFTEPIRIETIGMAVEVRQTVRITVTINDAATETTYANTYLVRTVKGKPKITELKVIAFVYRRP